MLDQPSLPAAISLPLQPNKSIPTAHRHATALNHEEAGGDNNIILQNMSSNLSTQEEKVKPSGGDVCSACRGTGVLIGSQPWPLEGVREPHKPDRSLEFNVYYY